MLLQTIADMIEEDFAKYIPYRKCSKLLGINSIDEFINYGRTLCMRKQDMRIRNYGGYESLLCVRNDFKLHDLGITTGNLRRERNTEKRVDIMTITNKEDVSKRLMDILDIRKRENQKIEITTFHIVKIKQYLYELDLMVDSSIQFAVTEAEKEEHILFT